MKLAYAGRKTLNIWEILFDRSIKILLMSSESIETQNFYGIVDRNQGSFFFLDFLPSQGEQLTV